MPAVPAQPQRGEIWFLKLPSDPPDKNPRPVVIVSPDERNSHPRADTVLVVPLSTTLKESPTHIKMQSGETGLPEPCMIQGENISTVRKQSLQPPKSPLRKLSETKVRAIAGCVVRGMGFLPADLA